MTSCSDCGSWGHRAKSPRCPYLKAIERQDQFGLDPPRPQVEREILDPAIREATPHTVFLP